jgi:hypothetical protein
LPFGHLQTQSGQVDDLGASIFFAWNGNRDLSDHWNFLKHWGWHWERSLHRNSLNNWSLDVVDFSLLNVSLHNWLGDDLIGWNLHGFCSGAGVVLRFFGQRFHLHGSIRLSLELNINILSLDNRLDVGLVVDFFSWSCHGLCSGSFLKNWFSHDGLFDFILRFGFLEFNSFDVVDNLSLDNRLSVDFLSRGSYNFLYDFLIVLNRSGLNRSVVDLGLASVDFKLHVFSQYSWLDVLFSNGGLSWHVNRNCFSFDFTIYNWFLIFSFGVHRSGHNLFSNDRGLYNSLFDDWLLHDSLSNNRLGDHFSGHHWFGNNLLSLSDDRLGVENLSSDKLSISGVLSAFGLSNLSGGA